MLTRGVILGIAAMAVIVTVSNVAVQVPINDWLTWGALTYPVSFLVTDLTNRALGAAAARRVVYVGFALAVILSVFVAGLPQVPRDGPVDLEWLGLVILAGARIAIASGLAFLFAQLLDIAIFNRLRRAAWWQAPFVSSTLASALDTVLFFALAFAGTGLPWTTWALGDYGVKLAIALAMLVPFRALMRWIRPQAADLKA